MDKLALYQKYIQDIINEYSTYKPAYGDVEVESIIDHSNNHYEILTVGWNGGHRVHGCVLHIDIKKGKIWIQHDGSEEGIANRLVDIGVPREEIVLAFHAPYKRQYTGFALE